MMRRDTAVAVGSLVGGVVVAFGAVVLGFLALTGGLRLNTPIDGMRAEVAEFNAEGFTKVGEETQVDRVCFLQCSDFRYSLLLRGDVGTDTSCEAVEARARGWLGDFVEMTVTEDPEPWESLCFADAWVVGRDRWAAFVVKVGNGADYPPGTDWVVEIVQR